MSFFKTKGDPARSAQRKVKRLDISVNAVAMFAILLVVLSSLNLLIFSKDEKYVERFKETMVQIEEFFGIPPEE